MNLNCFFFISIMKCSSEAKERFLYNYGWDHFWCDPKNFKNFAIKEFIKGPFEKPKYVYPIPFLTLCQQDGSPIRLSQGIPDCWAEYLICHLRILPEYFQNYELMYKKDVDVVHNLRKNYRLYIGQGIPDPWTKYPYINTSGFFQLQDLKEMTARHRKRFKNKLKEEACFCCQKKYLFECPDKYETNSCCCSCKNCHIKNASTATYSEKCKCFDNLQNCLSTNSNSKLEKKLRLKECSDLSSSSCSDSGTEGQNMNAKYKSASQCRCFSNHKTYNESSSSEKKGFENRKPFKVNVKSNTRSKENSKVSFYPYVKKTLKSKGNKSPSKQTQSVSKLIQTELLPIRISKTVQTENLGKRGEPKCDCSNKCFQCNIFQCKTSRAKQSCSVRHSFPNVCFTPNLKHCSAVVCPFSAPNHHMVCKPKHDVCDIKKKQNRKKQYKNKDSESELNQESETDENEFQPKQNKKSMLRVKEPEKHDEFKNSKNIYFCTTSPKYSKYLTENKLESYPKSESFTRVQTNEINPQSPYLVSNLANFYKKRNSFYYPRPDSVHPDKFKTFSYFEPRHSEFFFAENTNKSRLYNSNIKKFNYSDQTTMTLAEDAKSSKNDVSTETKQSKEIIKSGEFNTGSARKCEEFSKTMKKRRKLLANRKRRRKLASIGKVSFLEHQVILNNVPKKPELVNKHVQVEETTQDCLYSKRVPFSTDFLNRNKNTDLIRNSSVDSNLTRDFAWRRIEREISSKNISKYLGNKASEESLKQPLRGELQFGGILEKISFNSGSTWSSNTLKNMVNDLLVESNSSK